MANEQNLNHGAPKGNRNAAKGSAWRNALKTALAEFTTDEIQAGEALDAIARVVVTGALKGDKDCWKEIGERLDGKAKQAVDLGFDEDNQVSNITIEFIGAKKGE